MASLDSLPADQRAVLQLVLQRGRSYDDIARLLSIDPAAVRERALTAFEALGPQTRISDQRRALITDYLLGQLPEPVGEQTRDRLAESASERAWARVLASELAPLASQPLPEIPTEGSGRSVSEPVDEEPAPAPASPPPAPSAVPPARASRRSAVPAPDGVAAEPLVPDVPDEGGRRPPSEPGSRRSSRRGGLLLLALVGVVAVIVIVLASSGGGTKSQRPAVSGARSSTSTAPASANSTSSTPAKPIAQINLTPPSGASKAAGIAEVLRQGANEGIAIVAQNVTPNTTKPPTAYAVWLYNSSTDSHLLGFVNPGVTGTGKLSTAGGLPPNAAHYKNLIVTLETSGQPKTPGTIILQGTLPPGLS